MERRDSLVETGYFYCCHFGEKQWEWGPSALAVESAAYLCMENSVWKYTGVKIPVTVHDTHCCQDLERLTCINVANIVNQIIPKFPSGANRLSPEESNRTTAALLKRHQESLVVFKVVAECSKEQSPASILRSRGLRQSVESEYLPACLKTYIHSTMSSDLRLLRGV